MTWIWNIFLVLSLACSIATCRTRELSTAILEGASRGITLSITLAGPICLWSGINYLMSQTGITSKMATLLSPVLGRLFPTTWQNPTARNALCTNTAANLLGLGSAATPAGLQAARLLVAEGQTTDELCRLVVLNTASIQLLPTTVAALRAGAGAASPFDILPAVWITSFCALTAGLLAAKGLSRWL